VAIWQHYKQVLGVFSLRMRRNGYFGASGQKSCPRHLLRRPRFPIRHMYFHYRVTFTGYIRCFCATMSHDLVTLIFDLLTSRVFHIQCFSCLTHQFWLSYHYRLLSHDYSIWSRLSSETVTAHAPCHVTYNRGDSPHFRNPWPQFTYSLFHYYGATTKIKPCYRRK